MRNLNLCNQHPAVRLCIATICATALMAGASHGKDRPKPLASVQQIGNIGSVSGTLHWQQGEIAVHRDDIIAPGVSRLMMKDEVSVRAYILQVGSPKPGELSGHVIKRVAIGSIPRLGRVVRKGNSLSMQYSIADLPVEITLTTGKPVGLWIEIERKALRAGGTFRFIGRAAQSKCTLISPTVTGMDFSYVAPPK